MKLGKMGKILGLVLSMALLVAMVGISAPALANGGAILHPGYLTGSVTVTGYDITRVTVRAMDTAKEYSASVAVDVPDGASSIDYNLTVEGDRDYYVIATAKVATAYNMDTMVVLPVHGPVNVPVGDTVTQDLSVDPAFISGTISTTTNGSNTIEGFFIHTSFLVPEFDDHFSDQTIAWDLTAPGQPGRDYTLLVEPGLEYNLNASSTVNGILYRPPSVTVTAPGAGGTLDCDFTIEVTAATISGTALLLGTTTDVYEAAVEGWAYDPSRSADTTADIVTGDYNLPVDAGTWNVRPFFSFYLTTGDLNGLRGHLGPPSTPVTLAAGDNVTQDFFIDPGFITGTFSLSGANTDIQYGNIRAYSEPRGKMHATIHPDTGEYMFVASPGDDWQYHALTLTFDYPTDTDLDLWSYLWQVGDFLDSYTVASGETMSNVDLTYGTATVRLYYYVEGGGELNSPCYTTVRVEPPYLGTNAYGSSSPTTEGQVIGTLFPGTYTIEAFAYVEGSITEFGTFTVAVNEGDVVVIGGPARPTIKVTNPTEGEVIPADTVTVEGTATDDEGIASITINGEDVELIPTSNPADPNEVGFSHEVSLPDIGENTITVVATDVDETPPVTLELTVIREEVATPTTLTVTGGGWIDSPEGAYTADPSLTGKANFGFVSKYKKGANVPTGQTEFQFKAGDLNFHSDSYQWLVVAGARAQYKGTGTINGAGNYGLMLTAIDAKLTPNTDVDMFRIKIWDKDNGGEIVYDNQMDAADGANALQAIGGGSIVIHTGKK